MQKTDSELVYDSLEGNDIAFKELLKRHLKHVYDFVYQPVSYTHLTLPTKRIV